jgi:hypothetical protein
VEPEIVIREGKQTMVVSCEQVWQEVSNYLDGDVTPALRTAMDDHFRDCQRCTSILNGIRNVVRLYGDERMFELPLGFSQRLHRRLDQNLPYARGRFQRRPLFGWVVAATAAVLIVGSFEIAHSDAFVRPTLRSAHADPASISIPDTMPVVISTGGKMFHAAGCTFIHGKAHLRTITAGEAISEGYAPCVRCMKKYLSAAAKMRVYDFDNDEEAADTEAAAAIN